MEKPGVNVEFLCLSCGVQGLCSAGCPQSVEEIGDILCPKCGSWVLTTHFYKEKASLVVTV
jgi:DNA-directed RNA polymerase subunit RPC12/RpoP